MESGLVRGHAYSVTALQTVHGPHGETLLLRIRNPWGNEQEWNGAWSDNSREWQFVSQEEIHKMEFVRKDDGEFWMSFDDFYEEFEQLENCNLGPEVMNEIAAMTGVDAAREATAWTSFITNGGWNSRQGSAGGCRNYIDTFPNNPQYGTYLSLTHGTVENDGKCTVITAVLQKYRRELRTQGLESLPIGFAVYELGSQYGTNRQDRSFFEQSKPVAKNPTFINLREVTARFHTFPNNPQYGTNLSLSHGTVENDGKCTVITAVLQKYRRELRTQGLESLPIGFAVYELGSSYNRQDRSFFEQSKPVAKNPTFINLREVTARFRLPPGNYLIVPSTYSPNEDAEFLLRVYCSGDIKAQQV
uniref:Calpain catalytic domain-containing protein n=1 Tax=Panagrolaimus sp. ES5 TaxID=591445 RepID=A0AC34G5X3_9BILA